MAPRLPLLLALLAACEPVPGEYGADWNSNLPSLVNAAGAVASPDALYVPLSRAGKVVRLEPGASEAVALDLGERRVRSLQSGPDGAVLARTEALVCADPFVTGTDPDLCPTDDLTTIGYMERLGEEGSEQRWEVGPWFGTFTFSADERWAVAPIDPSVSTKGGGLVNLTSLLTIDLGSGERFEVPVGFAADRILFVETDGGTTGAVVLSRSAVAVVDLTADIPQVRVTYPLTLDANQPLVPNDVVLTPDGQHAIITISGSADLYVLDLFNPGINIVSLAGVPADLAVDTVNDQTLIVSNSKAILEVLQHDLFDVVEVPLEAPANHISMGPDYALLSRLRSGRDLARVDLASLQTESIRLAYSPDSVTLAPDGSFGVTFTDSSSQGNNLELVDLVLRDGRVKTTSTPFRLDGPAVAVAMNAVDDGMSLLVLQRNIDTLYELRWPSLQIDAVDLPSPPAALGRLGDGFWIAHENALGLASFYSPGSDVESIGGFGRIGLFDSPQLATEEE